MDVLYFVLFVCYLDLFIMLSVIRVLGLDQLHANNFLTDMQILSNVISE